MDGRRIGETGPPPSIVGDEDGEGRRHSGRHGTAEDDGRADRGQGCASSCSSAMNPVRASERGRGLTFCLACSPWPGPGRALLALLLGPGPLLGLGLPPVCVRTFVHRPHERETRAEQRGEDNFCSLLAAAASTATSLRFSLPPHSYPLHQFYGGHANFLFRMNEHIVWIFMHFSDNWQFSLICCWLVFDNILPVFSVTRLAQNEGTDPGPNMLRLHRTIMGHGPP